MGLTIRTVVPHAGRYLLGAGLALLTSSCAGAGHGDIKPPEPESPADSMTYPGSDRSPSRPSVESTVSFTVVSNTIPDDPGLEALVTPFRQQMGARISEVIGQTTDILVKGWPEGTLGNFAADALLHVARAHSTEPIDMALVNNGGLRIPIPSGSITVGQMFELMPFDNMISVLTMDGRQVETLAQDIARRGGAPVAGLSFRILTDDDDLVASDIRVAGEPLDPERRYRIAVPDYIANGGDEYDALAAAAGRDDLGVLVRDAFIQYLRERGTIEPRIEGRITGRIRR